MESNFPIKRRSWVRKVILTTFIIVILITTSFIIYLNAIYDNITRIDYRNPLDNPFPLRSINETRLHIIIEGNPEVHNYLGIETRQARYHMPFGFLGESRFILPPESNITDISNWSPDSPINLNWSEIIKDVKVKGIYSLADSPIHSGEYIQAQSLRWAVYNRENNTKGLDAATQQISRYLDGLWILTHATGIPGNLIRNALPNGTYGSYFTDYNEKQEPNRYYHGNKVEESTVQTKWGRINNPEFDFSNWVIQGENSRDQHIGTYLALASIIKFVTNTTLLARAGAIAKEITSLLIKYNWQIVEPTNGNVNQLRTNGGDMNGGPFMQVILPLMCLKVAAQADPETFEPLYQDALLRSNLFMTIRNSNRHNNVWPSFYPENLNWETLWSWWIFEKDGKMKNTMLLLLEQAYDVIQVFKNAYFQSLYLSLNPKDNFNSAAFNSTKYNRIINEIKDALARFADDRWEGGPNYYPLPNYSEIPPDTFNNLKDTSLQNVLPKSEILRNLLDEYVNLDSVLDRTQWAVPVDWRGPEDWTWQRSPFRYQKNPINSVKYEYYQADVTNIYWWARFQNIIGKPSESLAIIPYIVQPSEIYNCFNGDHMPISYNSHYSIQEALIEG